MSIIDHYKDAFSRDYFSLKDKLTVPIKWFMDDYYPWLPNPLRGVRHFWQRGTRGWSDYDLWDFDTHLANIIVSGLKAYKVRSMGIPGSLAYKYAKDPEHPELWDHDDSERAVQAWDEIVDKIILGFEVIIKDEWWSEKNDDGTYKYLDEESPEVKEGLDLFREYFGAFWI